MANAEAHTVNTTERLAKLRELMKKEEYNVEAFVVPSEDQREHMQFSRDLSN
jgi:Xaa-Pro aminopeptidase